MISRRTFLLSAAAAAAAGSRAGAAGARKKIALVGTVVRRLSHAQHFLDRFLLGYAWTSAAIWAQVVASASSRASAWRPSAGTSFACLPSRTAS